MLTPAGLAHGEWLDGYGGVVSGGDLFADAARPVAARWHAVAAGLSRLSDGDPSQLQEALARHAADLGLAFRVTGDEDERAWPLNAMPLVVSADEWAHVERGLIQRATLLEKLAADIYGPQTLVRDGHLPAAVIAGSPFFAPRMVGRSPEGGNFLHVYAADLARGPRGQWRVLQDRVRIMTGVGYALENRLAMVRTTGNLLADSQVRRLVEFFARMRDGMAAACRRESPRIALLTPGRFNQTYPEQAHLARYLGLPLVEGRDLNVVDGRLYIGTIAGPRRVDALWRWINSDSLDPLAFDARSQIGVPGLFDAWVGGGTELVNRPGVEVLETPALGAFLPRLCRTVLDEAPILPTIATWWCGQASERATVGERVDELALLPAFGRPVEGLPGTRPVAGAALGPKARDMLREALRRRPMDYCGQEIVHLSTTPAIIGGAIVPRPFTVRAFVARTADGNWMVMPGGFARLSSSDALPTSMMGEGDLSADVWIVDDKPPAHVPVSRVAVDPPISRGGGILASHAADNLFWFGRYNERAQTMVRIVRTILGSSMESDSSFGDEDKVLRCLVALLEDWDAITPAMAQLPAASICAKVMTQTQRPGGIAALMRRRQQVGLALRERFARDFWRIVSRPMPSINVDRPQSMLSSARWLTEHFSALAGLISENMVRSAAWRFLEIGQRLERAQAICRMGRRLTQIETGDELTETGMADVSEGGSAEALGVLLDLCDSQIIYRSRYLTVPRPDPVRDLVLLDPENPRALVFQVSEIVAHLAALPSNREDNMPEAPLRAARALLGDLQAAVAADMTPARLEATEQALLALSDELSVRYFVSADRTDGQRTLLL